MATIDIGWVVINKLMKLFNTRVDCLSSDIPYIRCLDNMKLGDFVVKTRNLTTSNKLYEVGPKRFPLIKEIIEETPEYREFMNMLGEILK